MGATPRTGAGSGKSSHRPMGTPGAKPRTKQKVRFRLTPERHASTSLDVRPRGGQPDAILVVIPGGNSGAHTYVHWRGVRNADSPMVGIRTVSR